MTYGIYVYSFTSVSSLKIILYWCMLYMNNIKIQYGSGTRNARVLFVLPLNILLVNYIKLLQSNKQYNHSFIYVHKCVTILLLLTCINKLLYTMCNTDQLQIYIHNCCPVAFGFYM